jgi:hypothetical protein
MTQEDLERRIRTLEDIKEIENLQNQYIYWLTNNQWDDIMTCFTENATANVYTHGLHHGKKEIMDMFKEEISKVNEGKDRDGHSVFQPIISVDGNKAKGQWLMYVWVSDPITGKAQKWWNGKYDNEFEKVDGKWKISSLKWTYPWPITQESYPK